MRALSTALAGLRRASVAPGPRRWSVVLIAVLVLATAPTAGATFPGRNGPLLLERDWHEGGCGKQQGGPPFPSPPPEVGLCQDEHDVFGLRFNPLRVFQLPAFDGDERLSPDGRWLAGTVGDSVWIRALDGNGHPRPVSLGDAPSWSPTGTRLVVHLAQQAAPFDDQLFVVRRRDHRARLLTAGDRPVWSPRGSKIALTRRVAHLTRDQVLTVSAHGGHARPILTTTTREFLDGMDWSPDGRRLVVAIDARGGRGSLVVVGARGHVIHRLGTADFVGAPIWSPDGLLIAYTGANDDIYLIDSSLRHARRLNLDAGKGELSLFPLDWERIHG